VVKVANRVNVLAKEVVVAVDAANQRLNQSQKKVVDVAIKNKIKLLRAKLKNEYI